jgi:hypothetical protein
MKTKYSIAVFLSALIISMSACKKVSDKVTKGNVILENPVTGQGYAGLKFTITETESKVSGLSFEVLSTTIIQEGVTNAAGIAQYEFYFKKHSDASGKVYDYAITFDDDNIIAPDGQYESNIPAYDQMNDGQQENYKFKFLPYGNSLKHFKNVNNYDVMMFKQLSLHNSTYADNENPFSFLFWSNPWVGDVDYYTNGGEGPNDVFVFQIKVTRNNIDSIYYDTFINNAFVTDTFKIWY